MLHSIEKPKGTFYSDFTFQNGYLYAIFEHDSRTTTKKVCKTSLTNETWINRDADGKITGFNGNVVETETHYLITLNK